MKTPKKTLDKLGHHTNWKYCPGCGIKWENDSESFGCSSCGFVKQEKEQDELIHELFYQACWVSTEEGRKYDHLCIGVYEDAQEYLLKKGIIKLKNCYRK